MLIVAALIALSFRVMWLSALFFICAAIFVIAQILAGTKNVTMQAVKTAGTGIKKELGAVAKAETSYPAGAMSETLKEVGRKAGEQVFDEDGRWSSGETSKAFRAKLGKSTKNFINKFLSLFK